MYSVVWGCGGFLTAANKARFDQWWRATFTASVFRYPEKGTIWDYYTKPGTRGFLAWRNSLQIGRGFPVLVNGAGGSGKTSLLLQFLRKICRPGAGEANLLHIYCNLLTSAGVIWNQILDHLEWDWGKKYAPQGGKKLICFIDDLHNTEVTRLLATSGI